MKTGIILRYAMAGLMTTGFFGCEPELENAAPLPTTIQFETTQLEVNENESEKTVSLRFDRPASRDGQVVLEFDSISSRLKTSYPLAARKMYINIARAQEEIIVKLMPSNNAIVDGDLSIRLKINSVSPGFAIGNRKQLGVVLLDDDVAQQPLKTQIDFALPSSFVTENGSTHDVSIHFSRPLAGAGSFEIQLQSNEARYGEHYRTEPVADEGKIVLSPAVGVTSAVIKIIPIDNALRSGNIKLLLAINNPTGAIMAGDRLTHEVELRDDEWMGLPKGYAIGGALGLAKTYTYDAMGRIESVLVKSGVSERNEKYYYDAAGRITRINSYPTIDTYFIWDGNRIVRSERVENNIVKAYTEYDYDVQGNVSGTANYFLQPDGEMKLAFVIVYLYFTDNNLYKALYYYPGEGEDDFTLFSTRTYDNYIDKANPFPMVDILPTVKTQNKLPGTFRIQENGHDLLYTLDYEFLEDGRVRKRFARNGNQVEVADYFYY